MPVIPSLMVLYTDDGLEVRYSDGSRLQLSPCGASMLHQDQSGNQHPVACKEAVHKWTQFVTSVHKTKVQQALDFRNRFAERPFLCPCLLPDQDVMMLYARTEKFAWPKSLKDCHLEILEDGSRRIMSCDELASMVLSPHGQDFTICYLSRVSEDSHKHQDSSQPDRNNYQGKNRGIFQDAKTLSGRFLSQNSNIKESNCSEVNVASESQRGRSEKHRSSPNAGEDKKLGFASCDAEVPGQHESKSGSKAKYEVTLDEAEGCDVHSVMADSDSTQADGSQDQEMSGIIVSQGKMSTPDTNHTQKVRGTNDTALPRFSVSPINQDISSISRVSSTGSLQGLVDSELTLSQGNDGAQCSQETPIHHGVEILHSSPVGLVIVHGKTDQGGKPYTTEAVEDCTPCTKTRSGEDKELICFGPICDVNISAGNRRITDWEHGQHRSKPKPYSPVHEKILQVEAETEKKPTHSDFCTSLQTRQSCSLEEKGQSPGSVSNPMTQKCTQAATDVSTVGSAHSQRHLLDQQGPVGLRSKDGKPSVFGDDVKPAGQQQYMWVTQHLSCNDCPPTWRHPLRLLQHIDPSDVLTSGSAVRSTRSSGGTFTPTRGAMETEEFVFTPVTPPLPLVCPFQHLHTWQPMADGEENTGNTSLSEFKQAHLKIIMMEGVVYRFIHLPNMETVEIYPGDGSVFISQGITAHFFLHLVWKEGKLEERTYSIKALPPKTLKSSYSIETVLKRAHRFLTGCIESSKLSEREELACWKHNPVQVVEPLPASILEECLVPGFGRFTAFTNGRIRVIFEDRTALDMVSDFSSRLHNCMLHSDPFSCELTAEKMSSLRVSGLDQILGHHRCRLLLACGKYIMIDVNKPGIYHKYVNAAMEWISWVQSLPEERCQFYRKQNNTLSAQLSADAELKKIECFNYIVEHSQSLNPAESYQLMSSDQSASFQKPKSTEKLMFLPMLGHGEADIGQAEVCPLQCHPTPSHFHPLRVCSRQAGRQGAEIQVTPLTKLNNVSVGHTGVAGNHALLADPKGQELLQGFNSVQDALLRTSQMIKDIDKIMQQRKGSS